MSVIFVELLNDDGEIYHSYRDELWRLVQLSGYETCLLGEINYESDNTYVCYLRNGNTHANFAHEQAKNRKCKLVLFLLEWGTWKYDNGQPYTQGFDVEDYWDQVWTSDKYYQVLLKEKNPKASVEYVFLGGHPDFGGEPRHPKRWDFVTLSYAYGVRAHKMQILESHGYTFAPSQSDCWGEAKEESLAYAEWGLALQQFNTPFQNSQRMVLFASWKLPIIVDVVKNPFPYKIFPEGLVHFYPRETICGDKDVMREAAEYNHHLVTQVYTFKSQVDKATSTNWYHHD
jgi:hypothetical protein